MANRKQDSDAETLSEAQPDPKVVDSDAGEIQAEEVIIERGGPKGPEPTRFGDWENNGRCTDF